MSPEIAAFLNFARSQVTVLELHDFAPNEPGHSTYVEILGKVLEKGELPKEDAWFITDAFFWTGYGGEDPLVKERRRKYQIFMNAVAMMLFERDGCDVGLMYSPNYVCFELLEDSKRFSIEEFDLLIGAFAFGDRFALSN